MIASNIFRFLAVAGGLGLGALAAPAEAAVFQASTTIPFRGFDGFVIIPFSLPQYSGPGRIVGVNIALSGSASASDFYPYQRDFGITVADYSSTWGFDLIGPPNGISAPFLDVSVTAQYEGGSVPPCTPLPECGGGPEYFVAGSGPNAFSGSVDVSDFSDFAGSGSNAFEFITHVSGANVASAFYGSATVTETILAAVPEPSTWTMALIGFAIVGFAAHSRRFARPPTAPRPTNEAV